MIEAARILAGVYLALPMALVIIGVLWSPFAVAIALMIRNKGRVSRQTDTPSAFSSTLLVATYSCAMLIPWIHYIVRIVDKPTPKKALKYTYRLLFIRWIFGPTFFAFLVDAYGVYDAITNPFAPFTVGQSWLLLGWFSFLHGMYVCLVFGIARPLIQEAENESSDSCAYLKPSIAWFISEFCSWIIIILSWVIYIASQDDFISARIVASLLPK